MYIYIYIMFVWAVLNIRHKRLLNWYVYTHECMGIHNAYVQDLQSNTAELLWNGKLSTPGASWLQSRPQLSVVCK